MKKYLITALFLGCVTSFLWGCSNNLKPQEEKPIVKQDQNQSLTAKKSTPTTEAKAQKELKKKAEEKKKAEPKKKTETQAPEKLISTAPASTARPKYIIANNDLSNLQLDDPSIPVYDLLSVQERRSKGLPTQLPAITPYRKGKVAYLTFDDGPDAKHTEAVLDILKRENIKGTFYVVGSYCYRYPKTLVRMLVEGHQIGNHSFSHNYDSLYPNVNNFLNEMYSTERAMREIIGYRSFSIRAPGGKYGHFTTEYNSRLKAVGLVAHDWNVCIDDAVSGNPTAADFLKKVTDQTASGRNPAIVLMHTSYGKAETVKALPSIISLLRERGYSFGVVTPMTPQPW